MNVRHVRRCVAAFCVVLLPAPAVLAHGAVAVAQPASIARDGVAIGYSYGYGDDAHAEDEALRQCLTFQGAPVATRTLCTVVQTFQNDCFAAAVDSVSGKDGFGWAVAKTQADAVSIAMRHCQVTDNSEGVCVIQAQVCDVTR
jgi:hypothetical protein